MVKPLFEVKVEPKVEPKLESVHDDDHAEEDAPDASSPSTPTSPTAPQPVFEFINRPINADNMDVDGGTFNSAQAIVEGFKDGFRLLPHQEKGRTWMQARESPTRTVSGGILADDMGYALLLFLLLTTRPNSNST